MQLIDLAILGTANILPPQNIYRLHPHNMLYFIKHKVKYPTAFRLKVLPLFGFLRVAKLGHFDTSGEDSAGCRSIHLLRTSREVRD